MNLFVLKNSHSAVIGADFLLPVAFKMKDNEKIAKGDLVITFREPNLLDSLRIIHLLCILLLYVSY